MGQYWAVIVVVGLLFLAQNGIMGQQEGGGQSGREGYACWGGCYNQCIIQTGKNPTERLPCYFNCLGSCIAQPATSDNQYYYCQLGCSLQQCVRFTSTSRGEAQESCLKNCSTKICSINT